MTAASTAARPRRPARPHSVAVHAAAEAKLRAAHELLSTAVAELSNGAAWHRMLQAAARFHSYSPSNVLLIATQCPQATAVAGFGTWKQLGRCVRQGEKGIAVLAPVLRRRDIGTEHGTAMPQPPPGAEDPQPLTAGTQVPGRPVAGFRIAYVFDLAQTDGPNLPTAPQPDLLEEQAPPGLYDGLAGQIHACGFGLLRHELAMPHPGEGRANGITDHLAWTVVVDARLSDAQAAEILAHELGHVLLHNPGDRPADLTRARAEVEAESVAFIVTDAHGLDSAEYTVPYVTGWANADPSLAQQSAQRVMSTAHQIKQRTRPPASHTPPKTAARVRALHDTRLAPQASTRKPRDSRYAGAPATGRSPSGLVSPELDPPRCSSPADAGHRLLPDRSSW